MGRISVYNHSSLPFHITARAHNRSFFKAPLEDVWQAFEGQLYFISFAYNVKVEAFLLMSNHFHLILSAPDGNLSVAMAWLMRETAREINRKSGSSNQVWGSRFYRSILKSEIYYGHAYKYLYRNAAQAGLCDDVLDYPYSTLRGLLGFAPLRIPTVDKFLFSWGEKRCLEWLNATVEPARWSAVAKALQKKEFKFPKDTSGKPSELEVEWL